MWRRTANKQVACNACGLYYKLYGIQRPIEMRKDIVYPRNRYSKLSLNGQPVGTEQHKEEDIVESIVEATDFDISVQKTKKSRRKLKSNTRVVPNKQLCEQKPIDFSSNVSLIQLSQSILMQKMTNRCLHPYKCRFLEKMFLWAHQ